MQCVYPSPSVRPPPGIKEVLLDLAVLENFDIAVQHQAPLSDFTTFRLGGICPAVLTCRTPDQLQYIIQLCAEENIKFILIGGGSNLVVSDSGIDCHVIRYISETPLIERSGNDLIVSASTSLDALAKAAAEGGLEGLNCTAGIPGTVGGAIVGNAGAFGRQIGDIVKNICVIDSSGVKKELRGDELGFAYRYSILKETGDIVVSACFSLAPGNPTSLLEERDQILAARRAKHPDLVTTPCAGSFFRNIEPTSDAGKRQAAGWFLDQAGGRSLTSGGAKIFSKHANIIIKSENCSAQDVYELSGRMARLAKDKFNLSLIREVRFVGKFDGMPVDVTDVIW